MSVTAESILEGKQEHLEALAAAYLKRTRLPPEDVALIETREDGQLRWQFAPKVDHSSENAVRLLVDARLKDFLETTYSHALPTERLLEKAMEVVVNLSVERDELYRQLTELAAVVQCPYDRCRRNQDSQREMSAVERDREEFERQFPHRSGFNFWRRRS